MSRVRWAVGVLVVVLALPVLAAGQGLGDAAKKETDRRTQDQKSSSSTRSFTQEDLSRGASSSSSPAEPSADAASPSPRPESTGGGETADSEEESRKRDEEMWRGRVADARARIEAAQKKHETLAAMHLVPGYEFVDERGMPVIHTVEELQALTARAKAEIEAAQRALADLLEQARHASVPPGWLR